MREKFYTGRMFMRHRLGCCSDGILGNMMRTPRIYFDYLMTNRSKTLYVGVTNNLMRRVREHKSGAGSHFSAKYKLDRLAYFERFEDVHRAIGREKEIKGWLRISKIALIVSLNPAWRNLSLEWYERHEFQPDDASAHGAESDPAKLSS